jgi:hypothetical protein
VTQCSVVGYERFRGSTDVKDSGVRFGISRLKKAKQWLKSCEEYIFRRESYG